ncbi:hypothetical protein KocCE7_04280 [Kocuria marina subsp. indica]|nr:hypothetical protein KocCE7_04280 [Kocuria indica]
MRDPELGPQRPHHPHRGGLLLVRVATRRRLPIRQFLRHNSILVSKVRSLQQTHGASAVVSGRTPAKVALGYVVAQVLGALVAVGMLWAVLMTLIDASTTAQALGAVANGYGENSTSQAGWSTVLLVEFVATTLFVLVVLGSTAPRANAVLAPVAIGASFAFLLTILAPFDGGSLNPARSTGTAVIGGVESLSQLWLFWVAPLLGGLVAGLIYRVVDLGRSPRRATVPPAEDATASTDTSIAPGA